MRPYLTLHDPQAARRHYASGIWRDQTFYDLLVQWAEARPDAAALRDGRGTDSWRELRAQVDGLADDLLSQGLVAGDRVSIWMSNRAEAVVAFLACAREGFACNPSLHKSYTCAEIVGLLDHLHSAALLTEPGWGADRASVDFDAMLSGVTSLRRVYTPAGFPAPAAAPPKDWHRNPDSVAYLAFTSGTTGTPKCVMHSDNTLLANGRDLAAAWGWTPETVILSLSPLSHHIAWVAVAQWLTAGCQLVTDDPPADTSRLDWIIETGATFVMGVPTHAMDILGEQRRRGLKRLGDVRVFYMAGSPIPQVVAESFTRQGITPLNVYGMTENSSHQFTDPSDPPEVWVATCGRGGPAYEVRIVDAEDPDRLVPPGQVGQIAGYGGALMLGYLSNQAATEASFNREGWFLSGDLGTLDEAGNLRITGRLKDVVIRGGHNIHPARVEELALRHHAVEKCAAFGVPDHRLGEKLCLAVTGKIDAADLLAHLDAVGLSKYDMPEWFLSVAEFPLTPSGKILKRELRAMVERGELVPEPVRHVPGKEN